MAKTIQISLVTTLDAKGARELDQWLAKIQQSQTKATPKSQGDPFAPTTASAQRAAIASQKLATEVARTSVVTKQAAVSAQKLATEEQRTAAAMAQAAAASTRAEAAAFRLTQAQDKAATSAQRSASYAKQMGQAFSSSLVSVLGPAAAVTTAIGAMGSVVASAKAGLTLKAELDATTASINAQLKGVRDVNVVYAEAARFAREYKLTQEETTQAISASIGVMRSSKAPVEDILGVLARMQVLSPEQSLQEAAIALKALASGDTTSLVTRFEVGRDVANQMKAEIQGGADAVAVMSKFLGDTGIGMDTLKAKTEGATGAMKDLKIANEELLLSQGRLAEKGVGFIRVQADATNVLADAISGNLTPSFDALGNTVVTSLGGAFAVGGEQIKQMTGDAFGLGSALQSMGIDSIAYGQSARFATDATAAQSSATQQLTAVGQPLVSGIQAQIDATLAAGQAQQAHTAELQASSEASMLDAAAKAADAAQTALMTTETQLAVDAFLALNPNLSASAAAAAATAAGYSPLIVRLIELAAKAREAYAQIAAVNALAGVKALRAPGSNSVDKTDADEIRAGKRDQAVELRNARVKGAQEAAAAEARYQQALGNYAPALDRANADLAQIGKTRGTDSAEYINQLTKITQLEGQAASAAKKNAPGGGGRAAGGTADKAAKAAEATTGRLSDIARQGGNKLADIEEGTQSKLAAIDAKYAEQRAESQRQLFDEIARMSAGEAYSQQLNDFEQFGKDLSDEQKALFAAREQAETRYNERIRAAQDEAKAEAVNGDADLAAEKLKIREAEARRQMEIENRAAQASIDSEGKNAAAIAQTAQEASAASKAQADTDIAIAEAKAAEKAGAMQAEKDAVIAAAEEQKNKVIEAATEQAAKVKGASDDQKSTVISNLRAQADAAGAWADAISRAAGQAQQAMDGVTGPPAAVGGEGGAAAEGGGEPGGQGVRGQGLGRGAASSGGSLTDAIQTINDAAEILKVLKPFVASNKGAVKLLNEYKLVVQSAVGSLLAIQDLRERLVQPQPILDLAVVARLKADVEAVVAMMFNIDASMTSKVRVLTKYLELETASIDILNGVIDLRGKLSHPTPPIDLAYVARLHQESQAVVQTLLSQMMPVNQQQLTLLQRYATAQGQSVQILTDVADLRERLSGDIGSPFDMVQIVQFAKRAAEFVRLIDQQIVPLTEEQAVGFSAYADAAGAAVQILIDVADLRERLSGDIGSPFDMVQITQFAKRAAEFTRLIQSQLVPMSEEASDGLSRYADAAAAAIQILIDVADLRKRMSEDIGSPINMALIKYIAMEAQQIARFVRAALIPTTEDQADALSRYADTVSSAVGIISDVAGLRNDTKELASPIPITAVQGLAAEAQRITRIVRGTLLPTTEDMVTGWSAYGEVVGSAVSIVSDVAGLRGDMQDLSPPLSEAQIKQLAQEARRVTKIVLSELLPTSEAQGEAAERFADTTGSAVAALAAVLDLPAKMFTDYQSPSDAQISRVVADANRIIRGVDRAARAYSTDGLEAAQAFGDATGSILGAFKDQLIFAQTLGSGDFLVDPHRLALFESGMGQTLAVANRLGAQAAAIPAGNIAALQASAAALTDSYNSMTALAAVPAGNLGGVGNLGGGGSTTTIGAINIYTQPGQNTQQIANLVIQQLNAQVSSRR
jgi:hypothetical protein